MRVLEKRLRRFEVGCCLLRKRNPRGSNYEAVLEISRNRARMRSEPLPDEVRGLEWTHKMTSLAEIILASQGRLRRAPREGDP